MHGIVTQAGGEVLLRSAPGQGTCFELCLPTVDAPGALDGRAGQKTAAVARGVILVAEDQEDVRSLVADILSQSGYTVIEAANGRFALEHLRDDNETITLVLTDLVMPEMSGQQLFEHARGLPRTIPFLFMSGYSEEGVPSSGPNCPGPAHEALHTGAVAAGGAGRHWRRRPVARSRPCEGRLDVIVVVQRAREATPVAEAAPLR